jgi:predicted Zn-ribbon and HTH transcriptional regulator
MPLDAIQGKNFAPVKPLMDAKQTVKDTASNPSSFAAFNRAKWDQLYNEQEPAWRETIEQARIIAMMRAGKLVMKKDYNSGGYVFLKPISNQKDRSNYPIFPQICETLKAKWIKAKPTLKARYVGDGYKTEIQMNAVDLLVANYFEDIFTIEAETQEAHEAQDYGTYIWQFYYDDKLNQLRQVVPIIQNESRVMVKGYGACYDCRYEGHPDDFAKTQAPMPQCPDCGSYRTTKMVPDATADTAVVTDIEEYTQGDVTGCLRSFAASRFDPTTFAHNSTWFIHSSRVPLRFINSLLGDSLDIQPSDSAGDIGLELMDSLAVRGGNIEGLSESTLTNSYRTLDEVTTHAGNVAPPRAIRRRQIQRRGKKPVSGIKIPADVPLEEIFPEGYRVCGFEDMRLQVSITPEETNVSSGVMFYSRTPVMAKACQIRSMSPQT